MQANLSELLTFAHRLADTSAEVIRPYFGQPLTVDAKADNSPVSIADREAERVIRELIEEYYPEHGIYGEEHGTTNADKPYVWVIDPIDGTRAFLAGKKEWGTLIALCEHGVPILGLLNQPISGERWVGAYGRPSETATRPSTSLANANISTTSTPYFTPVQARHFVALAEQCRTIIDGGDCYAYGLLARGEHDLVVDAGLKPYDILALVPIIETSGGIITGWDGAPVTLTHYTNVLAASTTALHNEALAILSQAV